MRFTTPKPKLIEIRVPTVSTKIVDGSTLFIDFGKAAFGTLCFKPSPGMKEVVVHLGERLDETGRLDRDPPGTIRYREIKQSIEEETEHVRLAIPPDQRNTGENAILMPAEIGEVLPFRYVEIEKGSNLQVNDIEQIFVHAPFDDDASSFHSSSDTLNQVWDISKYTIKATTFCGVYVDGDRERIPYEGDAYIDQLGHYCTDREYDFARYSNEYMIQKPTWCTEWHLHSVMMSWMDLLYSGNIDSVEAFFPQLHAKTLLDFAREDGLISVSPEERTEKIKTLVDPHFESGLIRRDIRDVMDWPPGSFTDGGTGERDNHEMMPYSTVTNAFHAHTLNLMAEMARVLKKHDEARYFLDHANRVISRINEDLFDEVRGAYFDGEGSSHTSLHSSMFMLAFELVPEERKLKVIEFIKSRGMACSVYGAQHLLDGLYLNGESEYALSLLTATHDRSWWNMIQEGSTMTLEAWGHRYKNNLDWNHAWGAAPANIIPRFIAGVRPLSPGFEKILIQPQPASLSHFESTVPIPQGSVHLSYQKQKELSIELPENMSGKIDVSHINVASVKLNNKLVEPDLQGNIAFNSKASI